MARLRGLDGSACPEGGLGGVPFLVERFEYAPAELLLRLSLRLWFELPRPAHPMLVVESELAEGDYPALLARSGPAQAGDAGEWVWRGAFAIAPEPADDPLARFAIRFDDDLLLRLPGPHEHALDIKRSNRPGASRLTWPYAVRRAALLFVVTCQLGLAPGWMPEAALADGSYGAGAGGEATPEPPPAPANGEPTEPAPETPPQPPPPGPGGPTPETPTPPPTNRPVEQPETPSAPATNGPDAPASQTPSTPPASGPVAGQTQHSLDGSSAGASPAAQRRTAAKGLRRPRVEPNRSARQPLGKPRRHSDHRRRDGGAASRSRPVVQLPSLPGLSEVAPLPPGLPPGLVGVAEDRPPAYLIPIYRAAGHRYHVPWRVLAAVNAIESDYGRNLAVSSAGAVGWMQFMPSTWREWAVDADHDGHLNPYSPRDAIFTAARYLQASGASRDLPGAIFAYNHADWYVTEVLLAAEKLGSLARVARLEKGYSLPLDARYMRQLGRTDDGVDIELAPDAALVYSITPGIVSAVASDPAGFGPNYPVVEATSGSLAGAHIYYGHVAQALVHPGQHVSAGQPIAIMGHTGDAVLLGHGHIEIGFSDAGGDPLSHHGTQAWTPAGDVMRSFLVTLSGSFGVDNA